MAESNNYYTKTIQSLFEGKDSIIEMAKIIDYDSERQVCRVWTMTSNQFKDDVPLYFPALYKNTGIISPPVKDSTSLLLWGADRQPFLLPIQITTPYVNVKDAVTQVSASPTVIDHLLTLRNIQGGEHLLRSLGGAYVFLKNLGDVEIGTSRLHRLAITEKDGAFDIQVERIKWDVGCGKLYVGPASMDSNDDLRTHFYLELEEFADDPSKLNTDSESELLNAVLNNNFDLIHIEENPKIYRSQKGHVFDLSGFLEYDAADKFELFQKDEFMKDDVYHKEQLSKAGRRTVHSSSPGREMEISYNSEEVEIKQRRLEDGEWKTSGIQIDPWGNLLIEKDGREYDLMAMLKWFYEDRT